MTLPLPLLLAKEGRKQALLVLLVGIIGFLVDSALIRAGIYAVSPKARWMIPAPFCSEWVLALWLNFGFMAYGYSTLMKGRNFLAAGIGLLFALMIYRNASKMGILVLHSPPLYSMLLIALIWAILLPLIYLLGRRIIESPLLEKGKELPCP